MIWLPARYACLQDISDKRIPISSDLNYLVILRYGYQRDIVTSGIWLPAIYCEWDNREIYACNILAIAGCLFPMILPTWRYWLLAWYGCSFTGELIAGQNPRNASIYITWIIINWVTPAIAGGWYRVQSWFCILCQWERGWNQVG